ncbi:MAG: hypothetical protein J0647_05250 [Campylobacteraceae bacterium]|nr:hypothetical protein [Campylobacteraceae bacterium]
MKTNWQRLIFEKTALYVHRHSADWFVPNVQADTLLQKNIPSLELTHLLTRISKPNPPVYSHSAHQNSTLQEFWIHLTNRCNPIAFFPLLLMKKIRSVLKTLRLR